MMASRTTLTAVLFGLLAVGCAAALDEPAATHPEPSPDALRAKELLPVTTDLQSMIQAALADAARRAKADAAAAPTLVHAEKVTWPDGSLGCPMPGRVYTMALVPGYRIRIQSGAAQLDYHAAERGSPFLCPPGRATDPVPDTRTY